MTVAAVNGPRQVVLSGEASAMAAVEARLAADGVVTRELPVTRAFHAPTLDAMRPAWLGAFEGVRLRPPSRRVVSNVTGTWAGAEVCEPEYWWQQMRSPVRFAAGVDRGGVTGPGADLLLEHYNDRHEEPQQLRPGDG